MSPSLGARVDIGAAVGAVSVPSGVCAGCAVTLSASTATCSVSGSTVDVMKVTDALARLDYVDSTRMAAMGWSYGGFFMNWLQGHTKRFKCLASMMGLYDMPSMWGTTEELWFPNFEMEGQPWNSDLYQKWSPSNYVKNFATPTLIITGERDYRVSYTQSLQYFSTLQTLGIPSRLIVFKNDGHWPSTLRSMPLYYNAHLEWFHKYLGGAPAPWKSEDMVNGTMNSGLVLHNGGEQSRGVEKSDINYRSGIVVLYRDGSVRTINLAKGESYRYKTENERNGGIWQAFQFGPVLVQDGEMMTGLKKNERQPRTIFGYVEPGHYIIVAVDGRTKVSIGMTETEMAELMFDLGCTQAMNLDGGYSTSMLFMGETINERVNDDRNVNDMLLFAEYDADGSAPALSTVHAQKFSGK